MKKNVKRVIYSLLSLVTALGMTFASACEGLLGDMTGGSSSQSKQSEQSLSSERTSSLEESNSSEEVSSSSSNSVSSEENTSSSSIENESSSPEESGNSASSDNDESSSSVSDDESSSSTSDDESSSDAGDDDSSSNAGNEDSGDVEEPELPNLLRKEVDALGHEIAYFKDGTWQDLGRKTPLNFAPRAVEERYGYQIFAKYDKADALCGLYEKFFETAVAFSASDKDLMMENLSGNNCYVVEIVDYSTYGLSIDEAFAVWSTVRQDCPEFFWASGMSLATLKDFYVLAEADYALGETRENAQDAIEQAALECDVYLNGIMSETERALTIHDYLAAELTYAYEQDGVTPEDAAWAHNIVGWAEYSSGVCETYTETYTYLCNLFDLDCITVSGLGNGGPHAWNVLRLENEWYNVDVTWDDGYVGYSNLIGRSYFGVGASEFALSHQAQVSETLNGQYQYALPTLSENTLSPVKMAKEGEVALMVGSLDKAFEKMTDEGGRYEVTLYPATNVMVKKGVKLNPVDAIFHGTLPKVAALHIRVERVVLDESTGAYLQPILTAKNEVNLQSELTLTALYLQCTALNKGDFTLQCLDGAAYGKGE